MRLGTGGRALVSLVLAAQLAACGGGGSHTGPTSGGQPEEGGQSEAAQRAAQADGIVAASDVSVSVDGKTVPDTEGTVCTWEYHHTYVTVSNTTEEFQDWPDNPSKPLFRVGVEANPGESPKVRDSDISGVPSYDWIATYKNPDEDLVNPWDFSVIEGSVTVSGNHYVASGKMLAGARNDAGRLHRDITGPNRYAQFRIEFTCP